MCAQRQGPHHHGVAAITVALLGYRPSKRPCGNYQRIKGELLRLDVRVSATAIRAVLRRHGIDPAPQRANSTWRAFLRQQAVGIVACDFCVP